MHAMIGGRCFLGFVLITIAKMDIFPTLSLLQTNIKMIRRYEGCYYARLESYYIIFYFETDWSHIHSLPSTTLTVKLSSCIKKINIYQYVIYKQISFFLAILYYDKPTFFYSPRLLFDRGPPRNDALNLLESKIAYEP